MTDNFGRLSTSAREWVPGGAAATSDQPSLLTAGGSQDWQQQNVDSDLNAVAVKEFVPGQGWNAGANNSSAGAPLSSPGRKAPSTSGK